MRPASLLLPGLVAIVVGFWPTWSELTSKLLEDKTYQHGLLIPPIVAYLAWESVPRLRGMRVEASTIGLLMMIIFGAAWAIARVAGISVVEQYSAVAMFPALVLATLGPAMLRALAFPLGYLFLMVPVGQALVPHLMEFTADFTVGAIRVSGIPVYREGLYFSLPSGDFEVAKACSGIRYLMASIAVGALVAHSSLRSWSRRIAFMVFVVVLPIVANGVRAYLIVMLAHLSDLRIAVGVDHLIYGWLFFGVVVLAMVVVVRRFAETPILAGAGMVEAAAVRADVPLLAAAIHWRIALPPALFALMPAAYFAWLQARLPPQPKVDQPYLIELPDQLAGWARAREGAAAWRPGYSGAVAEGAAAYRSDNRNVEVYVAEFASGAPDGREMISYRNQIHSQGEDHRDIVQHRHIPAKDGLAPLDVATVAVPAAPNSKFAARRVHFWFEVGGRPTTSGFAVKALEALSLLAGRPAAQRLIAVSAEDDARPGDVDVLDRAAVAAFTALREVPPVDRGNSP